MFGAVVPDVIRPDVELDEAGDHFDHRTHLEDTCILHLIPVQVKFLNVWVLLQRLQDSCTRVLSEPEGPQLDRLRGAVLQKFVPKRDSLYPIRLFVVVLASRSKQILRSGAR